MLSRRLSALPAFIVLYAVMYAGFGVASPFWARFFEWRGVTPEQIGVLFAAGTLVRLIAGPLVGRLADELGALRAVLATCAGLSCLAALGLFAAQGFWLLAAIHLAHAAALAPVTTLADALAVNAAKPHGTSRGFEYGWVRGAASAAFVVGTLAAGQMLGVAELSSVVWMHAALLAGVVFAAALIPGITERAAQPEKATRPALGGARELCAMPLFRRVILVAALIYGSHAMHDAFSVIRWNADGIGAVAISVLWSEAVVAEVIVFFWLGPILLRRLGPNGAAVLAVAAGVVRWVVVSQSSALAALAIVQPLHGFTFALLHLACMRLMASIVPPRLAATAQALYALGAGLATTLVLLLSGRLYGQFGAQAFLLMALLCAAALLPAFRLRTEPPATDEKQPGQF